MDFLNPLQVNDRYNTYTQVDVLRNVRVVGFNQAVQTLVEQQVGTGFDIFPGIGCELLETE